MSEPLFLGFVLGLVAGAIPGPFSALVAATSLKSGFRAGFRVAVVPLLSELVVLTTAALVVAQLPDGLLRWMGIVGGVLILYLARGTWKRAQEDPVAHVPDEASRRSLEAALLALVSPTPWVFWMLVGAPLFVGFWRVSWELGGAFAGAFILQLLAVRSVVAGLAAYGHRRLTRAWQQRMMKGASVMLVVAALVLAWQSWEGNFHRMVTGADQIRSSVTDSTSDGS
ncbi:MAG: LysE family transporter [Gemmatimonadota bacterium]|nr:LysE family transporter [Gemmatimonadota bacterium]